MGSVHFRKDVVVIQSDFLGLRSHAAQRPGYAVTMRSNATMPYLPSQVNFICSYIKNPITLTFRLLLKVFYEIRFIESTSNIKRQTSNYWANGLHLAA